MVHMETRHKINHSTVSLLMITREDALESVSTNGEVSERVVVLHLITITQSHINVKDVIVISRL